MIHNINKKTKELRLQQGLTLESLSKIANLSRGYLSKIERAKDAPRLSTLQKIANALDVELNIFFEDRKEDSETHNIDIMKTSDRELEYELTEEGYSYEPLIHHYHGKHMSPFLFRFKKGQTPDFSHDSEEFSFIVKGPVKLIYAGKEYLLEEGDGVYLDSRLKHMWMNEGDDDVIVVGVEFNYKKF